MITLPTRFDRRTCSLIDHVWLNKPSKGAFDPARSSSRVFLKKIAKADHLPCIVSLDILEQKLHPPKFIYVQTIDEASISSFREDLIKADIKNKIENSPEGDPEKTYESIR